MDEYELDNIRMTREKARSFPKYKVRKYRIYDELDVNPSLSDDPSLRHRCGHCSEDFEIGDTIYLYGPKEGTGAWVCYRHYGEGIDEMMYMQFPVPDNPWIDP